MTPKEYLIQALTLDRQIDAKIEQQARLRARLTSCTSKATGMPRGGGVDWTDTVARVMTLDAEINAEVDRLVDLKRGIAGTIAEVPRVEYRMLLEYRYLCGWGWGRIADAMRYSKDWVKHMHGTALQAVHVPDT